jgi:arylsulfatase A-like enzyme
LEAQGRWDNTIVIFTSDNGGRCSDGGSNGAWRGTKAHNYEGGIRVPLIVRWPGKVPAGTVSRELTTAMDFLPTLAAIGGQKPPDDRVTDGRDVNALWCDRKGVAKSPHQSFFYDWQGNIEAVRRGDWKLVRWGANDRRSGRNLSSTIWLRTGAKR